MGALTGRCEHVREGGLGVGQHGEHDTVEGGQLSKRVIGSVAYSRSCGEDVYGEDGHPHDELEIDLRAQASTTQGGPAASEREHQVRYHKCTVKTGRATTIDLHTFQCGREETNRRCE